MNFISDVERVKVIFQITFRADLFDSAQGPECISRGELRKVQYLVRLRRTAIASLTLEVNISKLCSEEPLLYHILMFKRLNAKIPT